MTVQALRGSIPVNADTQYSSVIAANDCERIAVVVRTGNGAAVDVALQGGWSSRSVDDTDWVDSALAVTGLAPNQFVQLNPMGGDGTVFAAFPFYRLRVVSTGQQTVEYQAKLLGVK